jgi:CBS domain containing-hemolysin-like protein
MWQLLVVFGLVLLNGFFVASEFAIVKVRSSQLEALEAAGNRRARQARRNLENLDAYLSATQLGITLASLGLGWVGEPFIARMMEPFLASVFRVDVSDGVVHTVSYGIAFAVITFLHIILGELAPKSVAITKPVQVALWVSAPLTLFYQVFRPFIYVLNGTANGFLKYVCRIAPASEHEVAHTEEELRVILTESESAEEVTPLGREILINALDMRKRVVRDITTPRKDVVFLNTEDTFQENLKKALQSRHTRFPLCDGHLDQTIGLVHIKDLLVQMQVSAPDLMRVKRDVLPVPEMMPLEKLLNFFLAKHAHLALVLDEFGGTVGIVTLDNVLEELVGDIQDEFDSEKPVVRRLNEREFAVDGALPLYELEHHAGIRIESEEVSTVGGYITHLLGHLPQVGEKVRLDGYEAKVTRADGRRVVEIRFKRDESARKVADDDED